MYDSLNNPCVREDQSVFEGSLNRKAGNFECLSAGVLIRCHVSENSSFVGSHKMGASMSVGVLILNNPCLREV